MRIIACSSSNRNCASARASSVLPTPVGPRNTKLPERPVGILQPRAGPANRIGDGVDGVVLADDALVQPLLHVDELLHFAFHQPAHRNVRPARDDLGDVFLVDLLLQHARAGWRAGGRRLLVLPNLPLELGNAAVLQFGRLRVVAGALRLLDVVAQVLELFLLLAHALNRALFLCHCAARPRTLLLQAGQFLLELGQPILGRRVRFLPQRLALDLELHDAALDFVELGRHRVDLHAQPGRRLVDQVDRLVGQKPIGDVAMGQHRRRDERRVLELHAVVDLVPLAQAAQDADRVLDRRLADDDGLEAALERGVLLDVLPIFVERRGADGVQLAAREHRLEQVRRVDRALRRPRADDRVQFVDEQHDLPLGVRDLLQDGFQPLFEFAAVFRAGDERAHVERDDALVAQPSGHVAADDALRQAFDDGRLADAGLADQHRVVLRPAREHLDHAPDLVVAADDRIELALARHLREVAPVPLERLILALGVLIGDALRAAHGRQRLKNRVLRHAALS